MRDTQYAVRFFDYAPNGYYAINNDGLIDNVNLSGASLLGLSKDELIRRDFISFILPEDQDLFRNCLSRIFETRESQVCEVRVLRLYDQRIWLRLNMAVSRYGEDFEIILALTDITFQKQIDNIHSFLLGQSWAGTGRDFFEALAEFLAITLSMDYVCIDRLPEGGMEAETVAVYFEGQHKNNIRYKLEDTPCGQVVEQSVCCYPSNVRAIFPRDELLQEMMAESYAGITLQGSNGESIGLIAVIGRKPLLDTGMTETALKQVSIRAACEMEHRQMEKEIIRSRDDLKEVVDTRTEDLQKAIKLLKLEITKRQQKEKSLILAEEKYRTVADFTFDWETWFSPDGSFQYVSPSCLTITGYNAEEFLNDPSLVIKITHPDDRESVKTHYDNKLTENADRCSIDYRIVTRDGEERWIGHSCQPVYDSEGKWIGQRGSNRDITERKRTEQVLKDSKIHLRKLMKHIDEVTELERTKIAREIHDELGHLLTSLKFDIEGLYNNPQISADEIKRELGSITCIVDQLIKSVRKIATELRPGILDHLGLIPAIEWQLEQFIKRTHISCECDLSNIKESFDSKATTVIFRIFQEILTNIARHSNADKVFVSVLRENGHMIFNISDNGVGFEFNNIYSANSLGLMGMRERALSVGGDIQIKSAPGEGTRVTLFIPIN